MSEILENISKIIENDIEKIIISKPYSKNEIYKKIVIEKKQKLYQIASYTEKQVFHENVEKEKLTNICNEKINGNFLQVNAWSEDAEYILLISKKGKCTYKKKINCL